MRHGQFPDSRQSIYLPAEVRDDIRAEAKRQDRSISWLVQTAWKLAREKIRQFPSVNTPVP